MQLSEIEQTRLWAQTANRLRARHLLPQHGASLSLRIPGADAMWFGAAGAGATGADATDHGAPLRIGINTHAVGEAMLHAAIYRTRPDVGAIAVGGGAYGNLLAGFGGRMTGLFDEQVRHLGRMPPPAASGELPPGLREGGNAFLQGGVPVCLGTTASRLAMNAELFEKCAKAYVLAAASGERIKALPWLVRFIANGRLRKDQRRATERFAAGLFAEESRGY
ncbi:MAG TPA: hypothetical protein VF472_03405 [Burkholderiaceae bacterium]